jgi:protein TonB
MKKLLIALLLLSTIPAAAEWTEGDTLWVNNEWNTADPENACFYGIVKRVDQEDNIAVIRYFSRETNHLISIQHRVASGDGAGLQKGKQLFFYDNGPVEHMEVYTLVHDESNDTTRNRIASESYLYPDGKTKEEVNVTYQTSKTGMETFSYTRKCFYPSGNLQYEESLGEKATEPRTVYYNEKGKKVKRPKQKFELFMQMPSFPGGQEALLYFLSQNVKYPPIAQENGIQGKVVVQFVVAKDGKIEEVEVLRSGGDPSLDREAVRVVKAMPKWQPGTQRSKPIRVKYTIPVNFRLM